MRRILTLTAALALLPGLAAAQDATATLMDADGNEMGEVMFTDTPNGLLVEARLSGVPAGGHGFHVHDTGACEGDFSSAGDHFAPDGNQHGFATEAGPHAGDLPNVFAGEDGVVEADVWSMALTVNGETGASVMDENGSAVILHAQADTYGEESGTGDRIACGVIEAAG